MAHLIYLAQNQYILSYKNKLMRLVLCFHNCVYKFVIVFSLCFHMTSISFFLCFGPENKKKVSTVQLSALLLS